MRHSYIQFHPLSYIVKLNIELCMSDLISKVVRKRDRTDKPHEHDSSSNPSRGTELQTQSRTVRGTTLASKGGLQSRVVAEGGAPDAGKGAGGGDRESVHSVSSDESGINFRVPEDGIVRTVAVQVQVERVSEEGGRDDGQRSTKSTTMLRGGW